MLLYIPYMDPMGYVSICVNYVNWCPAFHAFHAFHCIPASHTMGRIWARNKDVAFKKSPNGWPKTIKSRKTNASCLVFLVRHRPSIPGPASKSIYVNIKRRGQVKPVKLMQFPATSCGKVGFFTSSLVWC